jgi:hypothetical protein
MELSMDGLTPKQIVMMDIIWNCDGLEQFYAWFCSLPYADKLIVESLLQCIHYEMMERDLEMDSLSTARAYIDNIRSW